MPLLRFHTTSDEALQSLADYKGRMIEGQDEIYYVLAGDQASARHSPHLEALQERGIEALLLHDMMDGFMLSGLREYEGHKLRNVDDPDLKLPGEGKPAEVAVADESFGRLVARVKEVLGERIKSVRASELLRGSPARLLSPEDAPNREMERGHPLIADLARLVDERPADPLIAPLIEQIYDSALLLEGLHPNPAEMVARIQAIMEAAARGGQAAE